MPEATEDTAGTPARGKKLTVMAEDAELKLWKEAAWTRRVTLSEWVRKVLNATARSTVTSDTEPE